MIPTDDLIGRPWRAGARGPDAFDCWGLVVALAERCGFDVPPYWNACDMTRAQQRALMAGESLAHLDQLETPREGAIAYTRRGAHVGFVIGGRVVHALRGSGVVSWSLGMWAASFPDGEFYAWHA